MRIVVANEPRVYRDVIANVVRHQRPQADVVVCDPAALSREVSYRVPHLVICSRLSNVVIRRALAWVVLYPRQSSLAVISVAGRRMAVPHIEFADLLAIIDLAEQAACARSASAPGSTTGVISPTLVPLHATIESGRKDP